MDVVFRALPGLIPQQAYFDSSHCLFLDGKQSVVCRTSLRTKTSRRWTAHAPMDPLRQLRSHVSMNPVLMGRIRNDQDRQDGRQQEGPSPVQAARGGLDESSIDDDAATSIAHTERACVHVWFQQSSDNQGLTPPWPRGLLRLRPSRLFSTEKRRQRVAMPFFVRV